MNAVPVRHHNSHRHGFRWPAPILRPAEASLVARTALVAPRGGQRRSRFG